jgi:hypothetical protein
MMKPLRGAVAGLGLCVAASGALAEGWSVTDFDSVADRATCMAYSQTVVSLYRQRFNAPGFDGQSEWTFGGYDLNGPTVDALFICPEEGGRVAPLLVVYNADDDHATREAISDRLGVIWDEIVVGGGVASGGVPRK